MTAGPLDAAGTRSLLEDPPEGLVVIDVRTDEEFTAGRLAGAKQVDIYQADFAQKIDGLDRSVPYLVYCKAGGRSAKAVAFMASLGFASVSDFGGGWDAWLAAGYPASD